MASRAAAPIQPEHPRLLGLAIAMIVAMAGCTRGPRLHTVSEFADLPCAESSSKDAWATPAERELAEKVAGQMVALWFKEGRFPRSCPFLSGFEPVCLRLEDLDTAFSFENWQHAAHRTPGQIDLRFRNGRAIRLCFDRAVYPLRGDSTDEGGCRVDHDSLAFWIQARRAECGQSPDSN